MMKKTAACLITAAVILAAVFLAGFSRGTGADDARQGVSAASIAESVRLTNRISSEVAELTAAYRNPEGSMDPDPEKLTSAALTVYDRAQQMEKEGLIKGAAYCEKGYSVSFFLHDGTTLLYVPQIEGYYSGSGDCTVALFKQLVPGDDIPQVAFGFYKNPVKIIKKAIPSVDTLEMGDRASLEDVISFLGSLKKNHVRAIFWRTHGDLFEDDNGTDTFVFGTRIPRTVASETKFAEDCANRDDGSAQPLCVCGDGYAYYAFSWRFIEKYMSEVDGGLFFTIACYSNADGGKMAQTFLEKGFDAYIGTTDGIQVSYANAVLRDFAKYLSGKDDSGRYCEAADALIRAVRDNTNLLTEGLRIAHQGEYQLVKARDFRLIDPDARSGLHVRLTSSDGTVDRNRVSVKCLRLRPDGKTEPYDRVSLSDLFGDSFAVYDLEAGDRLQMDISVDGTLLKRVTLPRTPSGSADPGGFDPDAENLETVDLRLAWLDIIVQDSQGAFVEGLAPQVSGTAPDAGTGGLMQRAALTRNSARQQVYRIPVEPGTYRISIRGKDAGTEITDRQEITADTTLTYTLGEASGRKEEAKGRKEESAPAQPVPEKTPQQEETPQPEEQIPAPEPEDPASGQRSGGMTFADAVRQAEEKYGRLAYHTPTEPGLTSDYYTGVFLIDYVDFDRDGTDELIIGHAEEFIKNGISHPSLDIWRMENGCAVCVYENAMITHSDVGARCEYFYINGTWYLITGHDGSSIDLTFLAMSGGAFVTDLTLSCDEDGVWTRNGSPADHEEAWGLYQTLSEQAVIFHGAVLDYYGETKEGISGALEEKRAALGLS